MQTAFYLAAFAATAIVLAITLIALASTWYPFSKLGTEFMPSLNEGTLMYMPVSLPGLSVTKAAELLKEAVPNLLRVALLYDPANLAGRSIRAAAPGSATAARSMPGTRGRRGPRFRLAEVRVI